MAVTKTNIVNQSLIALGELVCTDVDSDSTKRATTMKELYDIKLNYLLRKYDWKFAITRKELTVIDYKLNYDAETVVFVIGEVISGAAGEGTIEYILRSGVAAATLGTFWLSDVTTGFVNNEALTGSGTGAAVANGVETSPTPVNEFDYIYALPSDYIRLIDLYPDNVIKFRIEKNMILCGESSTLDIRYVQKQTDPDEFDAHFVECFAALLAREACMALTDSQRLYNKMDEMFEDKLGDARFSGSIEDDLEEIEADDWLNQRN